MKKSLLTKTMLLLCALIAGSSSSWATTTYQHVFNAKPSTGDNVTLSSVKWNISATNLGNYNSGNYAGVQIGTSKADGEITLTSSSAWGTETGTYKDKTVITEVRLWLNLGGTSVTPSVTIGGKAATSDGTTVVKNSSAGTDWTKATKVTFTPATNGNTGVVVINVATVKAGYICCMEIDCEEAESSDPSSEAAFTNTAPSIDLKAGNTYSQVATTADGYTGTVTYAITANTAGATLEGTTLTVTQEGSVTVKATAPAITGWAKSEATYTLTVNDTRSDCGLAFATATQDVVVGEVLSAPTLTNPHSLTVTYSSLDETVATVDASGNVTGVKIGSTTIKATFAGNASYKPGSASYTINVTKAPFSVKDGVFDFVEAAAAGEDYGSGVTLTSSDYTTGDKTWTAGNVTMVTSDGGGNGIRWWNADKTLRFYNKAKATFSVPSGYVITKIVTTGANFNSANVGTLSGTTWTGTSNSVVLSVTDTRNIKTITVSYTNITSTYGWGTFVTPCKLDFASTPGLKAYIVTGYSGTAITVEQMTGVVPANTPLLLEGTMTDIPYTTDDPADVSSNKLQPGTGAAVAAEDGKTRYVLGVEGGVATFLKIDDVAATVPVGKAYLQFNEVVAAPSLSFDFNDVTSISTLNVEHETLNGEFYNLAGQRVANPTKGLYIVNGKKVILK